MKVYFADAIMLQGWYDGATSANENILESYWRIISRNENITTWPIYKEFQNEQKKEARKPTK